MCHRNLIVWPCQIEPLCRPLLSSEPHGQVVGIPVHPYTVDLPRPCQITGQPSGHISKVLLFVFPGPGTPPAHLGMSDVDPTPMLAALNMGHSAVKSPVPLLVTEPALTPSGAFLVAVVGALSAALTAVPCHPNLGT